MASVRILLIVLCAVNARGQLLPIDLTALTSGLLPLGGDANHRGVLNTVGDILSLGVNTVGGIGHTVLGLRESEGQNQGAESSNPGYGAQNSLLNHPVNPYQGARVDQNQRPNTPWNGYNNNGYVTQSPHDNARKTPYPISSRRDPEVNVRVPAETPLSFHEKADLGNLPVDNGKYNPVKEFLLAQNEVKAQLLNNQIILPNGKQIDGILYLPNSNRGTNVLNLETPAHTEKSGCIYFVKKTMNVLGHIVPTITCTDHLTEQGYVLMNINGQRVLVPVANLLNGLQVDTSNLLPNPGPKEPNYVFAPNNGQFLLNTIGTTPVNNPVVNYVTGSPYLKNANVPNVSDVNAEGIKGTLDNIVKVQSAKDGGDVENYAIGSELPIAVY